MPSSIFSTIDLFFDPSSLTLLKKYTIVCSLNLIIKELTNDTSRNILHNVHFVFLYNITQNVSTDIKTQNQRLKIITTKNSYILKVL